jgi:hypothetical protein
MAQIHGLSLRWKRKRFFHFRDKRKWANFVFAKVFTKNFRFRENFPFAKIFVSAKTFVKSFVSRKIFVLRLFFWQFLRERKFHVSFRVRESFREKFSFPRKFLFKSKFVANSYHENFTKLLLKVCTLFNYLVFSYLCKVFNNLEIQYKVFKNLFDYFSKIYRRNFVYK